MNIADNSNYKSTIPDPYIVKYYQQESKSSIDQASKLI